MGDVLLPDLQIGNLSVTICVRASRFWDFCDPNDDSKLLHCDLVLIDEEGNSIHGTIYPPFIEKFRPLIKEGCVYNIKYFRVRAANNLYRPVPNDNMITFTNWTKLEEVVEIPPAFPEFTYTLTPIEQLHSRVGYKEYYTGCLHYLYTPQFRLLWLMLYDLQCFKTDTIGIVTSISDVAPHHSRGQQSASLKRTVSICSASNTSVSVVLWGGQATMFPGEQIYKDGQGSPQIILFVGTLVKKYADGLCLSGNSPCKWYVNPDIPESKELMASVHKPVKWTKVLTSNQHMPSIAEEQKVSYIKYLHPFENKGKEFLVTVSIKKIANKWWYNACKKCSHTAAAYANSYRCTDRECANVGVPNQRYRLHVTAGDETGDTDFILFGRMAQRIVKRPCDMLVANNPAGFIPDAITRLLEKTFVWNVSFSGQTITYGDVCFQVNAVIREINTIGVTAPMSPAVLQQASLDLSHGASSSVETTPQVADTLVLPPPPLTSQGDKATIEGIFVADTGVAEILPTGSSTTKEQKYASKKRSLTSPKKPAAKKLFTDADYGTAVGSGSAIDIVEPSTIKDD